VRRPERRRNSDQRIRELERRVLAGDRTAEAELDREYVRAGTYAQRAEDAVLRHTGHRIPELVNLSRAVVVTQGFPYARFLVYVLNYDPDYEGEEVYLGAVHTLQQAAEFVVVRQPGDGWEQEAWVEDLLLPGRSDAIPYVTMQPCVTIFTQRGDQARA
jgi:hypothetical protein